MTKCFLKCWALSLVFGMGVFALAQTDKTVAKIELPPKEIYIYLDISKTIVGAPYSLFAGAVEVAGGGAFANVLNNKSNNTMNAELGSKLDATLNTLLNEGTRADKVRLSYFGEKIENITSLLSNSEMGAVSAAIKTFSSLKQENGSNITDFKPILNEIQEISKRRVPNGGIRIFIIVSDFVHELEAVTTSKNVNIFIEDFNNSMNLIQEDTKSLFDSSKRPSHFLFCFRLSENVPKKDESSEQRRNIADAVIKNLEVNFFAATKNASESNYLEFIKDRLIQPLKLEFVGFSQKDQESNILDNWIIRVTNTSDQQIQLKSIDVSTDPRAEKNRIKALEPEQLFKPGEEVEFIIKTSTWNSDFMRGDEQHNHYLLLVQEPEGAAKPSPLQVSSLQKATYSLKNLRAYQVSLDQKYLLVKVSVSARQDLMNVRNAGLKFYLKEKIKDTDEKKKLITEIEQEMSLINGQGDADYSLLFPINENSIFYERIKDYSLVMERNFKAASQADASTANVQSPPLVVESEINNSPILIAIDYYINYSIWALALLACIIMVSRYSFSERSEKKGRGFLLLMLIGISIGFFIYVIFNSRLVLMSSYFTFYLAAVALVWAFLTTLYLKTYDTNLRIDNHRLDRSSDLPLYSYLRGMYGKAALWALGIAIIVAIPFFLLMYL